MPTFHVTSPDGRTIEVSAPEGATEDQAIKYAQDNWETLSKSSAPQQPVQPAQPEKKETTGIEDVTNFAKKTATVFENLLPLSYKSYSNITNPITQPIAQQATGMVAKPIGDVAGLEQIGLNATGLSQRNPSDVQQQVTSGLTYQPTSEAAQSKLNPLNWPGIALGAVTNALQVEPPKDSFSPEGVLRNAWNEAVPQAINILGAKLSPADKELAVKQELLNKEKSLNAPTDKIRESLQKPDASGLKFVTPSEKGLEAQYSKISTQTNAALSVVNEEAATRMAANEIGLKPNEPFTPETIEAKKEQANKVYSDLVETAYGALPPKPTYTASTSAGSMAPKMENVRETIRQTPEFRDAIGSEINRLKGIVKGNESAFKSLKNAIPVLQDELKNLKQDPQSVLGRINLFREQAKTTFTSSSPSAIDIEQGRAKLFIANKLEDLIEQNLSEKGNPGLIDKMKEARKQLAQIHAIEDSLTIDGKLSIKKIAAIDKKTDGKLLTGNLKRIATMGQKYSLASQEIKSPVTHLSYFDAILAGSSIATGHAEGLGLVLGKYLAPTLAKAGYLQGKTPDYVAKPNKLRQASVAELMQTPAEVERQRRKKERANK